ncbi:MAG: DUF2281 domain-containing protein [Chloroflexota bacterium]
MSSLTIDLPDNLSQQLKTLGMSDQQINKMMVYLLRTYLAMPQAGQFILESSSALKPNRKAGSAKHLNIIISDDFDDPLEDFAEYMS